MVTNAERIALVVRLATEDAADKIGRELAVYSAKLAHTNGFGNSRRWLGLSELLAISGRNFIDELASQIRAIEVDGNARNAFSIAVESYLVDLDHKYQTAWANDAPWRRNKEAPPPPAWQNAKAKLLLAFQVQQSGFGLGIKEPPAQSVGEIGPRWRRFDEAVNLVAWLLTSPKAPTDYGRNGAKNLARLVNEGRVRCRAGSIAKIRFDNSTSIDPASNVGQLQLRLITACVADAIVEGAQRPIATGQMAGPDLLIAIRNAPHSFPPNALEWLKAADKAANGVGRPEEILQAYLAFVHAFDDLGVLRGITEGREWRMTSCDRSTSSYSIAFDDDATVIDVMGLQFSYADLWGALGEEPESKSSAAGNSAMAVSSKGKAEHECQQWLTEAFASDPNKRRAKADYREAALAKFSGRLSVRGFMRAWDAVAPAAGRSTPGRKS